MTWEFCSWDCVEDFALRFDCYSRDQRKAAQRAALKEISRLGQEIEPEIAKNKDGAE